MSEPTAYQLIGGETGVRRLVDLFYDNMDQLEEVANVRAMHAKSLRGSRQKLFLFLSGWLGGPDLYVEKYGHPRLRMRHLPFSIGIAERDQWMHCMRLALHQMQLPEPLRAQLEKIFSDTANHMRNRAETETEASLRII